jgi:glycosyltransferase involved in cell wall biosynthesis
VGLRKIGTESGSWPAPVRETIAFRFTATCLICLFTSIIMHFIDRPIVWHLLTGEYPPAPGGVSDYTRLVAQGLAAAGDLVEVWAPKCGGEAPKDPGVRVNWLPSNFGPEALSALKAGLRSRSHPRRLLVQYVPHAFGYKAMNVGLVHWLMRARRREHIWVMFHEVCFPRAWDQPLKHNFLATVQRWMARQVAQAARRRFVSTPHWETLLRSFFPQVGPIEWLPVPSTVATHVNSKLRDEIRTAMVSTGGKVLGHFGTFSDKIVPILTGPLVAALRVDSRRVALLIGRGGEEYVSRLCREYPELTGRAFATGAIEPTSLADHLAACDLLLQPYPEGLTARRTSLMASAALGLPIVASRGPLTESVWDDYQAVCLVENTTTAWTIAVEKLLAEPIARAELGQNVRRLYWDRFTVERTVQTLQARHREDNEMETR